MALYLLGIDALKLILNRVEIDDKSSLLMTGYKSFIAKLTQVDTAISILPYIGMRIESLAENEDGFHLERRLISCQDDTTSVRYAVKRTQIYGLLPLYFKNATRATTHHMHLHRVFASLSKLKTACVYMVQELIPSAPSTLVELHLILHSECMVFPLTANLPKTLRILEMKYVRGDYVKLTEYSASLLPRNLESLSHCIVICNMDMAALPRSLTKLVCRDTTPVEAVSFPPGLIDLNAGFVTMASIAHLPLQTLRCSVASTDSLLPLQSLTKLTCFIHSMSVHDWNEPVCFPSSVTDLTLSSTRPTCCLISPSVKKLVLSPNGYYNVFEIATHTWRYHGEWDLGPIPDNVVHAYVNASILPARELDMMFAKLQSTVETLCVLAETDLHYSQSYRNFHKCTKLIVPWVSITYAPPLATHVVVRMLLNTISMMEFSSELDYLSTASTIMPDTVRKLKVSYLKCHSTGILDDLLCIAHISEVVLTVYEHQEHTLPTLPSNAKYEFIE